MVRATSRIVRPMDVNVLLSINKVSLLYFTLFFFGINKNDWADIFKFGTVRLNLLANFVAFD